MEMSTAFWVLLISCVASTASQSCGLTEILPGTYRLPGKFPDAPGLNVEIWRGETTNVSSTSGIASNHTKYLSPLFYVSASAYTFNTNAFYPNFIQEMETTLMKRSTRFTCSDGTFVLYDFEIEIEITDKFEPIFEESSYTLNISEGWDPSQKINGNTQIIVVDKDEQLGDADLSFSTTPGDIIRAVGRPLWRDPSEASGNYTYAVDLYLGEDAVLGEGDSHTLLLLAASRIHSTAITIQLNVGPYVGTTTNTGQTEETSTELPEPSTTPEPESCGFIGYPSTEVIRIQGIQPDLVAETELWRATLYNVESTAAVSHPHTKYVFGYRNPVDDNYWLAASPEFSNFVGEQGSNVIVRDVVLFCKDGDQQVRYRFEIELDVVPIVEPTIRPL